MLERAVRSAVDQPAAGLEVIVVDDGSFPPVHLPGDLGTTSVPVRLIRQERGGVSRARNAGLAAARGRYVQFLDSDDCLEPAAVPILLTLAEQSAAAVVVGRWRDSRVSTGVNSVTEAKTPYRDVYANAVAGGWVTGSFMLERERAAFFKPDMHVWEAAKFVMDSLEPGGEMVKSDCIIVNITQHDDKNRLSVAHDHDEPYQAGLFFAGQLERLRKKGLLNAERASALNARVLSSVHSLLRGGEVERAGELLGRVEWKRAKPEARPGSFAWVARVGGLPGARAFIAINRVMGRA